MEKLNAVLTVVAWGAFLLGVLASVGLVLCNLWKDLRRKFWAKVDLGRIIVIETIFIASIVWLWG